jgi:hypothetical protein
LLTKVVEELQHGVEDDPSWTPEVTDYIYQLRNSFCSPSDSECSSVSCAVSPALPSNLHTPESADIPHTTTIDATTTAIDAPDVPLAEALTLPDEASQEVPNEPSEEAAAPPTEAPAFPNDAPSAFVKKNNRKGKSKH